jgi:hypothetical protein
LFKKCSNEYAFGEVKTIKDPNSLITLVTTKSKFKFWLAIVGIDLDLENSLKNQTEIYSEIKNHI